MPRVRSLLAVLALVGASLVVAPSTAAEVDECAEQGVYEACVNDASEGDEQACRDGNGAYEGDTTVEAHERGSYPRTHAQAGGEHDCGDAAEGNESQRVVANASTCVTKGVLGCKHGGNVDVEWTKDTVRVDASYFNTDRVYGVPDVDGLPDADTRGFQDATVTWTEEGDCTIRLTHEQPGERRTATAGCPAGPPGSPNPGWGNVTSDTTS
jgi:hypothetical protein